MEQTGISNITLKDTGVYSSYYSFHPFFRKNNINMLSQVLDEDLMNELMLSCGQQLRSDMRAFVDLMRCRYLGEPFPHDDLLDTFPIKQKSNGVSHRLWYKNISDDGEYFQYGYNIDWRCLGFNRYQKHKVERFIASKEMRILSLPLYKIFEAAIEEVGCPEDIIKIMEPLLNSYKSSHALPSEENEASKNGDDVVALRKQLADLITARDNLDKQIYALQQKIELLSYNRYQRW